ncbi:MAG: hypothetical protein ACRDFS_02115, partial [Chloroflexota bacterium]
MSAKDPTVEEHLKMAHARARKAFDQARDLWMADFYAPSLVWAVRAAEVLMRDFVLAPHFMLEGTSWARSLRLGSKVLGSSDWKAAFVKAEEWWGPFDEPLTTDESNAWQVWIANVVTLRGHVIHGRPVPDVTRDESL